MDIRKKAAALLTAAVMAFGTAVPVHAETAPEADDPYAKIVVPSGMDIKKLRMEINDVEKIIPDYASAEIGVFVGDDTVYTGYFGYTDSENGIAADETSVYEWGSISKTLVWVSVMQLWEQGRIDLDKDVREYLPQGFFAHTCCDNPITMMNLMCHNAGWQETTRKAYFREGEAIPELGQILRDIEPPQIHRPGEVTAYSNYGAAVAGYVVECISGMSFADYVHKNIFEPLGMEKTAILPDHSDSAYVYEKRPQMKSYGWILDNRIDMGNCIYYIAPYPAGAATGTLEDLMTYAKALADPGAPLFMNKATQEVFFTATDHYGTSDIPINAHGLWFEEHTVRTLGHNGATMAGQAYMSFDPVSRTGLVIMVNEPDGNKFLTDVPDLVFGSLTPGMYGEDSTDEKITGYYLPARSVFRGMLSFTPYLMAVDMSKLGGNMQNDGRGVHQLVVEHPVEHGKYAVQLFGERVHPDGSGLAMSSTDLIYDSTYLVKLVLLALYVMLAAVSVFIFLTELKFRKHGRQVAFAGHNTILAGHIARLVSVVLMLASYSAYAENMGGITYESSMVIGIMQMVCMAVIGISAVYSAVCILRTKPQRIRNALNIMCCIISLSAVLYFEMYNFWVI
ncbi:MAG: serine hydrolase [Oscillospiraceae bacterium]|nr:serine hydrolase [Oscillospiraceae bacterium]